MNIMWYIEDIRVLGIIVRVWILRQANWVLANIWKESNYGLERKDAFYFSELIRKGKSTRTPELDQLSVPEQLKNIAKMYRYLFPRAHCIEHVLMYARLAYYMKWDSRVYSSVVNKKKALS